MNRANLDDLVDLLGRWASGRGPLYLLLAARLRELIDDGVLAPGASLPPDRVLARRLAVGRGTVVAAYDLLQQEGRVVRRQGSGTRVAPLDLPATRAADGVAANPVILHLLHPPDGVRLLTCAAPGAPPPELLEAYQEAFAGLARERGMGLDPAGRPELRAALAAYYTGRGVPTAPGEILVTTGAQQALTLLAGLLLAPGDRVLTESPTYPGALEAFRHAAAVVRPVDPAEPGEVRRERAALLYCVPTNRNPDGSVMDEAARRRLAAVAAERDLPVIEDEVGAELGFSGPPPAPVAAYARGEQVVAVGSLSKLVWGGLRVGWVRAAAPLVSRLARLRAVHDLGGEVLGQLAAAALLRRLDEVRAARTRVLREGHDLLVSELRARLPSWTFEPAAGGQTLWVRLPRGDADSFAQVALRHGVAVPPGRSFDPLGGHAAFLRLHFLLPPDELTGAVAGLAAAWAAYDGSERTPSRSPLVV
ncbi:PLP-dependent aminotransferase family protein [Nonomuraea pusilla]|uniref:DNA-binding transcriptional regulator, MocR family, contains an aminotransferase domain n=1 Tax=Nonomuraea pusilla TaxID=46177 RepID=A0A1H7N0T7_9ACTN|nr:PLP-dependent aminotransferase family protein [Nonomuraea pusilla]SEL17044.1 DNA-binding transcriptional regulator, MocR family, contains an aminotransferase domain [Nonomuraea pusilla]